METSRDGIKRRGFLSAFGAGVAGATLAGKASAAPATTVAEPGAPVEVALNINGQRHRVAVEPRWNLLYVIREKIGLTGSKAGCERGECGACTVLIDGVARYACLTLAVEAEGREITTIEGLLRGEQLGRVQQAFADEDGMQCGYCTPGQIMAAEALLRNTSAPDATEIRQAMSGNLCRCGAYDHIAKAVRRASAMTLPSGGAR
jgi:xanthine dehydrogenase YagT iron-sulfur-binding subunit